MKRTMILSAVTAVGLLCAAGQAQVVISQVYGGGGNGGATYKADFIELKNIGNAPVDITGWTVQRNSASNATTLFPQLSAPFPAFVLQPGQYYLVECATGANGALPALPSPNLVAANMTLGANDGKVALVSNATAINTNNPALFDPVTLNPIYGGGSPIVDFVGYGANASHFEGVDGTPNTSNSLAAIRNDNGCQDTNDNLANFTISAPSPHAGGSFVPCGAAYPDLALQFAAVTCNPEVGGAYEFTAQLSNLQALAAEGTTVTLVLPPTMSYSSSNTGGTGTASYNAATRTLTWNVGTLGASASASIIVSGTAVSAGGLTVTGSTATTTANDPTGNNTAISYNEVIQGGTPLTVVAIGNASEATTVDEDGFPRQLGNIYRSFVSQNGEWSIFRTDLAGLPSQTNGGVIIGHNVGGVWSYTLVAREGTTAPDATLPDAKIDNSGVNNIQGINNAGQYVYSTILRQPGTPNDTLIDAIVKGSVADGIISVIKEGDAAVAPELAGRNYTGLSSATIQNDGTVSFVATLSGTGATNAAFLKNNGNTVLLQKGVTIPTGATLPLEFLDGDGSSDGRGLMVSADGNSWIGTGDIQTAGNTTTDDNAVIVNGTVVLREGSPFGMFTDPAVWATFGTQQIPWVQMTPDGHWYMHGTNAANPLFNSGQDWVARDGIVLSATMSPIVPASTELWSDNFLQRTYVGVTGNGDDFAVAGLTNRSTVANGKDEATDGVVVFRGTELLVREGMPVEYTPGVTRYLNIFSDNRSFIAGDKLYLTATLRNAGSYCGQSFSNLPQVIVAIDLPDVVPTCTADVGAAGGEPGQDGLLDNNDFIAFINYFFEQNPIADMGMAGGEPGSDTLFDNNDFIAFINFFFAGCP